MSTMKTPGVYIVEKNAFPNSVVEAATAVPAFIGYTEYAKDGNKSLLNKPWKISSMAEFEQYFGGAPVPKFAITKADNKKTDAGATEGNDKDKDKEAESEPTTSVLLINGAKYTIERTDKYNFYYQMRFFFANGGGTCYIVSVDEGYANDLDEKKLTEGITALLKEEEPTMVLAPEAVYLKTVDQCANVQGAILKHCGYEMKNRVAIFDIYNGFQDNDQVIKDFREKIGTEFLSYGAAYYPWMNTSIVSDTELNFLNIEDKSKSILKEILSAPKQTPQNTTVDGKKTEPNPLQEFIDLAIMKAPTDTADTAAADAEEKEEKDDKDTKADDKKPVTQLDLETAHKVLSRHSSAYSEIMREILLIINQLPPSTAMAGIYTLVDSTKEVWKAPANIGLSHVISPTVSISFKNQEDLNVPMNGKAVNAIRYFVGEGVKVWGARTLDGNSLDWRYINVRRTMLMLEESIKNASKAYVFEPNVANTWVSVRSMINSFLTGIWKRGGLAGSTPEDAFSVHIGLGETMTPDDILEGIMRITILVAISRPAEFIEITFQQQMQKS
ncbi:Phage tail sheath protein [compost metagenome]